MGDIGIYLGAKLCSVTGIPPFRHAPKRGLYAGALAAPRGAGTVTFIVSA